MLKTVRRAFQIEDIRKRIFYTFVMLIVVRLGSQLPTPGVDPTFIQEFFEQQTGDAFNFFEAFTGGSFTNFSVFALSITPYITSSIIMQLLTIAIPKLEEMQKEGEEGRKKIAAITRYVTVGLALIESTALAVGLGRQGLLEHYGFVDCTIVVCTLTAGSAFLMWIGERITENESRFPYFDRTFDPLPFPTAPGLQTMYARLAQVKKLSQVVFSSLIQARTCSVPLSCYATDPATVKLGVPYFASILPVRKPGGRDSAQIITPFMRVRTYLTRNFATLGPL